MKRAFALLLAILLLECGSDLVDGAVIAYWKFDEGLSGQIAGGMASVLDSSGNGHHGTPRGDPTYGPGLISGGLSLDFDGSEDAVFINDHPDFYLTKSLTLEAIINRRSNVVGPAPVDQIVFRGDDRGARDPYFLGVSDDGNLRFSISEADATRVELFSPNPLPFGETIHVAGTLEDATGLMRLFVNGNEVASIITNSRPFADLDPIWNPGLGIGNTQATPPTHEQFFDGIIDEVRISDVALNPMQFIPEPSRLGLVFLGLCSVLARRQRSWTESSPLKKSAII